MTWATPHSIIYLDEEYELDSIQGRRVIDYVSRRYEIEKHWNIANTAITHNYYGKFEIQSNQLYLTELNISADKCDLKIGNISGETIFYRFKRRGTSDEYEEFPHVVRYSPIKELLEVSSYIVIVQYLDGRPFPPPYYPHQYKKVIGFQLEEGQVKQVDDYSQEAESIRLKFDEAQSSKEEKLEIAEEFRKKVFRKS
jgi:hypothetical protein